MALSSPCVFPTNLSLPAAIGLLELCFLVLRVPMSLGPIVTLAGCGRGRGGGMSSHRPLCRPRSIHSFLHGHRIVSSAALYFSYLILSPLPVEGQGGGQMGCSPICLFQLSPRQALSPCWTVQQPEETHSQSTTKQGQLRMRL